MTDLAGHDDIFTYLRNDETADAKRLRHRFKGELRLLDDLGWEREPDAEQFELTMPARELRPIIERVYWSAVAGLNKAPDELTDEARDNDRMPIGQRNLASAPSCLPRMPQSCGPFAVRLRSIPPSFASFCGPNPREHPRTSATAPAIPGVFAAFRSCSRIFGVLEPVTFIGANG